MSSDELIGPALPPVFRKDSDEDSDDEQECKFNKKKSVERNCEVA